MEGVGLGYGYPANSGRVPGRSTWRLTATARDARDRYRGALLGLAAGDALRTTVEFERPGTFEPLTDLVGGGPFNLRRGAWTDDTSMVLCLAESLIERRAERCGVAR